MCVTESLRPANVWVTRIEALGALGLLKYFGTSRGFLCYILESCGWFPVWWNPNRIRVEIPMHDNEVKTVEDALESLIVENDRTLIEAIKQERMAAGNSSLEYYGRLKILFERLLREKELPAETQRRLWKAIKAVTIMFGKDK